MVTIPKRSCELAAILVLLTAPQTLASQQSKPAGVVASRHAERATAAPPRVDLAHAVGADSSHGHPWRWVGTGALVGGVGLGTAAGISASHSNDDVGIPAGPAIVLIALIGAVAGGLVGGLAWLVSH